MFMIDSVPDLVICHYQGRTMIYIVAQEIQLKSELDATYMYDYQIKSF